MHMLANFVSAATRACPGRIEVEQLQLWSDTFDEGVLCSYSPSHERRAEPNTVVMHIRMLDKTAQLQQEAVGVLGINLIHACFTKGSDTAAIIGSLLDELSRARVEVG